MTPATAYCPRDSDALRRWDEAPCPPRPDRYVCSCAVSGATDTTPERCLVHAEGGERAIRALRAVEGIMDDCFALEAAAGA